MIVEGRLPDLVFLIILAGVSIYFSLIADKWSPELRKLAGVDAIPEIIGRAVELGRPVHFTTGYGGSLNATEIGPQIMAGLSVYSYVARLCAKLGAELIVSVGQTDTIGLLEEYTKEGFRAENQPVPPLEETLRFHSRQQFAFISAVSGLMRRERPAANIVIGPIWAESSQMVNSAAEVGAMQLIGTARTSHIPWFAILSDYTLMGEEIYVAGAQISGDREVINTIAAQDIGKGIGVILVLLGSLFMIAGNRLIITLLGG